MSTDANAPARDDDDVGLAAEKLSDYDDMLDSLDTAIEEAQRKIESGRVYDAENEKIRCKWIRTMAYAVNVRRQVTNDRDLAELAEEVDELKQRFDDT
jgi:flagellar biosynthesis chaperone FliJ